MSGQSFESALSECLAALDRGESVEAILARFPAHAMALRPALALRAGLTRQLVSVPSTMRTRGEQQLRAALAGPAPRGGIPVLSSLFSVLPKAAAQALIALVVTGGAVGASAAVGGPNIPGQVLHAVGLVSGGGDAQTQRDGATPSHSEPKSGAAAGATAAAGRSTATATPGSAAGDAGVQGLCQAFVKGGLGQNGRSNPQSYARLLKAAGAESVTDDAARAKALQDFCAALPARPDGTATAGAATSATAGPSGRGKGEERSQDAQGSATPQGKAPSTPVGKGRQ